MRDKIGIIGFGNMGLAIAKQLSLSYQVYVFDKDKDKLKSIAGINIIPILDNLLAIADVLVLAVKPQDMKNLLSEIRDKAKGKLVISIAAGITTPYIEDYLPNARVVRCMPNLPVKVRAGMTCLSRGISARDQDLSFAEELFKKLGKTIILDEGLLDAATAIVGSGPGLLYYLIQGKDLKEAQEYAVNIFFPELSLAAEELGFSKAQAKLLAETTVKGGMIFLQESGFSAAELKEQVASKAGTTQAGLEILAKGGSLTEAAQAALLRSKELLSELTK